MNKKELIKRLKEECNLGDCESDHGKADDLLLEYINDKDVTFAFMDIEKWYA